MEKSDHKRSIDISNNYRHFWKPDYLRPSKGEHQSHCLFSLASMKLGNNLSAATTIMLSGAIPLVYYIMIYLYRNYPHVFINYTAFFDSFTITVSLKKSYLNLGPQKELEPSIARRHINQCFDAKRSCCWDTHAWRQKTKDP